MAGDSGDFGGLRMGVMRSAIPSLVKDQDPTFFWCPHQLIEISVNQPQGFVVLRHGQLVREIFLYMPPSNYPDTCPRSRWDVRGRNPRPDSAILILFRCAC